MRISTHFYPRNYVREVCRATTSLLLAGGGALIVLGLTAQMASAHSLTVTASAACTNGGAAAITYTVTSWDSSAAEGSYSFVEIDFNGVPVDNEALSLPGNTFTATLPAPALTNSVTVTAVTDQNPPLSGLYNWGDGESFFSTSSTGVTIPTDCTST